MTKLKSPQRTRTRAGFGITTVAVAILIAGCGSSGGSSTITIGNQNPADNALAKSSSTGSTGATGTASTPTSGPLSKEPAVSPPKGAPPTTLVKRELIVGTGPEAKPGQSVTVNYVGALYSSRKVFDASWKRHEPFVFALGKHQVITGWEEGVAGMKVGGRREVIVPPGLGYGSKGVPPSIPANATLVFVIDLLAV